MISKERNIAVLSGFMCFMGGLYLFAIMSTEINFRSFLVIVIFALLSLYLSASIAQSLSESILTEESALKNKEALSIFEFQEKLGHLKTENLRLSKLVDAGVESPTSEGQTLASPLMLRQRAFIHDVAGPISIAQGMIEMALKSLEAEPHDTAIAKAKLEKAMISVAKISKKIQENRDFLIMSAS